MLIRESTRRITSALAGLSLRDFLAFRPPTDSLIRRLTLRSTDIAFVKKNSPLVNETNYLRLCLY